MKYLDEYRDPNLVRKIKEKIKSVAVHPQVIMEICGGQTHSILRYGLDQLLPPMIELVHGPGCPVCVTPLEIIDKALQIAAWPEVIFCSFGDMLRVPGSQKDLFSVKAEGGDVRIVYSPLDAVEVAKENPSREVVFFAVGFETTAPGNAMAAYQAKAQGLNNFSMLVSHVLVPPAMEAVLSAPDNRVKGFLAAGHVCTIMGYEEYGRIAEKYKVPIVVTGFEPLDIMEGLYLCIKQLEEGRHDVENEYSRSVKKEGNKSAQDIMRQVFTVCSRKWRGIGEIPQSGLGLSDPYASFDAERRFGVEDYTVDENPDCISGEILKGLKKPRECPAFGTTCTPEHPFGATMVSSEGACNAYFKYRNNTEDS